MFRLPVHTRTKKENSNTIYKSVR